MRTLPPGTLVLGRYLLADLLGAGASGAVYAASDRNAPEDPEVALKLLRPELAEDAGLRARFRREAGLLQRLAHPRIVGIRGHGEASVEHASRPLPYLVMERLRGRTLRSQLETGAQPRDAVLPWVEALAAALGLAHRSGILHGDIKPENVFLTPGGPKLVDFGSAKVHGFPRLTATGELAGTPLYMAPEVISGGRELDARADVYALGVTVYEALAGRSPFEARHPGRLVAAIMSGATTPLAAHDTKLAGIEAVVARAMHRDVLQRFPDVEAFARALAQAP